MAKRKQISKKLRFEVFKRDSFTCQYCGSQAPDVILNVDHVDPVANGGTNDILNLITSCFDCNSGKRDRLLSDDSVVAKQKQQLAEINERRNQLQMMIAWRDEMKTIDNDAIAFAVSEFEGLADSKLTEYGRTKVGKWIKKFGLADVLKAIDVSAKQYLKSDDDGASTQDSVRMAFKKIPGICASKSREPYMKSLFYTRGILRNRLSYMNEKLCIAWLVEAHTKCGISTDELRAMALSISTWTEFREQMEEYGAA